MVTNAQCFTDDYSGAILVYFLKSKSDDSNVCDSDVKDENTGEPISESETLCEQAATGTSQTGRWVYPLKTDINGSNKHKAWFVAKGYNQKAGTDSEETFSPTADMTSVRVLMQKHTRT